MEFQSFILAISLLFGARVNLEPLAFQCLQRVGNGAAQLLAGGGFGGK